MGNENTPLDTVKILYGKETNWDRDDDTKLFLVWVLLNQTEVN